MTEQARADVDGYLAGLFPGGTGVSHLTVYDWSNPDGLVGGSAHAHLACTEGYVVVGGRGRLQTLDRRGFAETELRPLTVAWFSPGVIHRLVNDGDLQIVVVMQNSGLPEAGDCVLSFPPEYLASREDYDSVAMLPEQYSGDPSGEAAAQRRKRLAVEGFVRLRERVASEGPSALEEFYQSALALRKANLETWRTTWSRGPLAAALQTGRQLDALSRGDLSHLHEGRLTVIDPPETRRLGMCGRLATYPTQR